MWWFLAPVIPLSVFLAVIHYRRQQSARRRLAAWSDLHARGKLFAEQLVHVRMGCWEIDRELAIHSSENVPTPMETRPCRWPLEPEPSASGSAVTSARNSWKIA
jgi:hypothetical protein